MGLREKHHVVVHGEPTRPTLVLVHGYGTDQQTWRTLLPLLADYQVVTFDQAGSPSADPSAFDPERHASLEGYADDLVGICLELGLSDVVVVGHSISAMTGVLAHLEAPSLVSGLVLIAPSPRYVDDPPYVGGFSREQVDDMLASLATNFSDWAAAMGPEFVGRPDRPELAEELVATLQRNDPAVGAAFAALTFLTDMRAQLPAVHCPTLVIQPSADPVVPAAVGEYVHEQIPRTTYARLEATGHFPHLSAPEETAAAVLAFLEPIRSFLRRTRA